MKKIITIIGLLTAAILLTFFLFSLNEKKDISDKEPEEERLEYYNEKYGYKLSYNNEWETRERENLTHFHSLLNNKNLPSTHVNWTTYVQGSSTIFSSFSSFDYIEGAREYQIDHQVYPNPHNLTVRQWYDLFVITEALHSKRITEGDFIRKSKNIIEEQVEIDIKEGLYDPWSPKGEIFKIDRKDVLKVVLPGDYRYSGYQHYILLFNNYFLVFKFGYGGTTTNRDLWKKNNEEIIKIIKSITLI